MSEPSVGDGTAVLDAQQGPGGVRRLRVAIILLTAVVPLLAAITHPARTDLMAVIGVCSVVVGLVSLCRRGPLGAGDVLSLSFLTFVGVAAIYIRSVGVQVEPYTDASTMLLFAAQVVCAIGLLFSESKRRMITLPPAEVPHPLLVPRGTMGLALTLVPMGAVLGLVADRSNPIPAAMGYVGVLLASVTLMASPQRRPGRVAVRAIVFAVCAVIYIEFIFGGYGRLTLVSLGLAPVLLQSVAGRWRLARVGLLVALIPSLIIFTVMREDLNEERGGTKSDTGGMTSVVSPLMLSGELWNTRVETGEPGVSFGSTLGTSAVTMVPREIWPEKPIGFGAVLVKELRPSLYGTGHSEAATLAGEMYYDFNQWGYGLVAAILYGLVRGMDALMARRSRRVLEWADDVRSLLIPVVVIAGIPDLLWDGTFTFSSRAGVRSLLLLGLIPVWRYFVPVWQDPGDEERPEEVDDPVVTRARGELSGVR